MPGTSMEEGTVGLLEESQRLKLFTMELRKTAFKRGIC